MSRIHFFSVVLIAFGLFSCRQTKQSSSTDSSGKAAPRGKVLVAMMVTSISIEEFPKYNMKGEKWDAYAPFLENPDISLSLKWMNTELYRSATFEDYSSTEPVKITNNLPLDVKPFDQNLMIEIFDEDGLTANDNMAVFNFKPLDFKNKTEAIIKSQNGQATVKLGLQWIYQ